MPATSLTMITYHGGNSGISAYNPGPNFIVIQFKSGERYVYNHSKPGRQHVDAMKWCATHNAGLTTYINQHVRDNYAAKLDPGDPAPQANGKERPKTAPPAARGARKTRPTPRASRRRVGNEDGKKSAKPRAAR